jgi:hypothetical protein
VSEVAHPERDAFDAFDLSDDGRERLLGLLRAGDPRREVWFAWNAKEVVRQIYDHTDHQLAVAWVTEIVRDFADTEIPLEVKRLLAAEVRVDPDRTGRLAQRGAPWAARVPTSILITYYHQLGGTT